MQVKKKDIKEIVVISGKGGTGKTTILSSFVALSKNAVIADCDVDAADLHLILNPTLKKKEIFKSGKIPVLQEKKCTGCGKCIEICRFNAIKSNKKDNTVSFDLIKCEGCSFCARICQFGAISMVENEVGHIYVSDTKYGPFIHAKLGIAAENSGKMVSEVRKIAKEAAKEQNKNLILIDGSPGIGCSVIASLTGVEKAVIVIEPTLSGFHDAKSVIDVCKHFQVPMGVIINKYDLNESLTNDIDSFCSENKISLLGKIPFDKSFVESLVEGKILVENNNNSLTNIIKEIWRKI